MFSVSYLQLHQFMFALLRNKDNQNANKNLSWGSNIEVDILSNNFCPLLIKGAPEKC